VSFVCGWDPLDADIKYDWLAARAALKTDAYANPLALASEAGVTIAVNLPPGTETIEGHPRTPGALLLAIPLTLIPFEWLFSVQLGVTIATLHILARTTPHWIGLSKVRRVLLFGLALISLPSIVNMRWAGLAGVVAVLALSSWRNSESGHEIAAGVEIAVAIVLKVFPLLIVFAWIRRQRWRSIITAGTVGILLNAGGLLLPGISLGGAIEALTSSLDSFGSLTPNGSLVHFLGILGASSRTSIALAVILTVILVTATWRTRSTLTGPWLWLLLGLLLIPLSWASYDIVLVPMVLTYAVSTVPEHRYVATAVALLWVIATFFVLFLLIDTGFVAFVARTALLLTEFGLTSSILRSHHELAQGNTAA
jgi:hypothetical protein